MFEPIFAFASTPPPTYEHSQITVVVGLISTLITCVELLLIYLFEFFMVAKMTELVGLRLWPLTGERAIISQAMTRSILELGHPKDFMYGIDPLKHTTGCMVLLNSLLYASKKGVSKLLIKAVFKKLITRVIAKSVSVDGAGMFADLVISVPINALWNALVVYYTLQTCKYIILGPSFAFEALSHLANEDEDFGELEVSEQQQVASCLPTPAPLYHTLPPFPSQYIPDLQFTPTIPAPVLYLFRSCVRWDRSSLSTSTSM